MAEWLSKIIKKNDGIECPFEKLNKFRYYENWLQSQLIASSLNGCRN